MTILGGIDIGGTKCAVVLGKVTGDGVELLDKVKFPTPSTPEAALAALTEALASLAQRAQIKVDAIGISCGGPLNSETGRVLSPPNLPGWDDIDVLSPFQAQFHVPVGLQNDANACALAEWKWGAGAGTRNMVFLTFGTGMGAGLILGGRLYTGANDMAGEVGHIRLEPDGPIGYGKAGSFEGFCSGGGIEKLARSCAKIWLDEGRAPSFCKTYDDLPAITTEKVGIAAGEGDALALEIWQTVGYQLGRGLAVLVDVLNPEKIVIGSIYARQQALLEPVVLRQLEEESLAMSSSVCQVVPAGLGENVGDFASLSVALYTLEADGSQ